MPEDKLSPGDRFRVRAATWNNLIDASEDYQLRRRLGAGGGGINTAASQTSVIVKNASGVNWRFGEVAEIDNNQLLNELTPEHLWFSADQVLATGQTYGITRRPLPAGQIDELQLSGVVRAYVNVTDEAHRFARIEASNRVLQSALAGPVGIVWKPAAATGEQLCAVLLGVAEPLKWVRFTLNAALATTDETKAATIAKASWTETAPTDPITVTNLETHTASTYVFEGDSGDAGIALHRPADDSWHIVQMECP